MSKGVMHYCIH